jgi:hypothetical protein
MFSIFTPNKPVDDSDAIAEAIGKIESSGRYDAVGPLTKKNQRAYGKYQVMDFNIPVWSKEALGRSMTPQEFLADTAAQDKIARYKLAQYVKQYGNADDAASVWFSGRPMSKAGNAADILGTTTPAYVQKFRTALGVGVNSLKNTTKSLFVPMEQAQANTGEVVGQEIATEQEDPKLKLLKLAAPKIKSALKALFTPLTGSTMHVDNSAAVLNASKPKAPAVKEVKKTLYGNIYLLDTGTEVRDTHKNLVEPIKTVYAKHPDLPKGVLEALLMKESTMGHDNSNQNDRIGKYAWLVGFTNIAKKDLLQNGIVPDLSTREGAIEAAAQYWKLRGNKNDSPMEIYNDVYSSGLLKPEDLQKFDDMIKYYASTNQG